MAFKLEKLAIPDVVHIEPDIYRDERGWFAEIYKASDFKKAGINEQFIQFNHSQSEAKVLRGLHYQIEPKAQSKLITVVKGEVFDVAVDIRKDSEFFGKWVGKKLNAEKKNALYIPAGFAHGFCVLSAGAEVIYYCSELYSPEHERGIVWNDPIIAIDWPIKDPIISTKDKAYPRLGE
jgi:dTDP-4-dehydrorhamnose 3,5-epimerase